MELRKINSNDIKEIKDRHIWMVRYFPDYLNEIYDKYPDLPMLCGIIDTDPSKQGRREFRGHSFEVSGIEKLSDLPKDSVLIICTGYYKEEFDLLVESGLPDLIGDHIYYYANRDTEYYEEYLEKYNDTPLKNLIVFRSGMGTWEYVPGMDFTENSRALYEHMQKAGLWNKYEMVWLVKDPEKYSELSSKYKNTSFVSYDWATSDNPDYRERYYSAICLAKYFFFTHACGFCRLPREGQIRVQLWHGCGFKTVKNTVPQRKRYEYTTVVSNKYADIHIKEFGLDEKQMLVTGYAKQDWLFHVTEGWQQLLGIPNASKYIFWLPTFRSAKGPVSYMDPKKKSTGTGLPVIESVEQLEELNNKLKKSDAVLIVKLHPLQKDIDAQGLGLSNVFFVGNEKLASCELHINNILGDATALISDYSSAAVDYLLLNRPISFTLDDIKEYKESRGFVLNPIEEWLPGKKIFEYTDFICFIDEICKGIDSEAEIRDSIRKRLLDYYDDGNCERIVKRLGL